MRQAFSGIGLLAICAIGAVVLVAGYPHHLFAAPKQQPIMGHATVPPPHIEPHRAIYNMNLASVKTGSNLVDVSGRMLFEWRDVCDGWAIQQHMQLHFTYNDGGTDQDVVSSELTWEAKDGKHYNFNIRRTTNNEETENYRGKASQNDDGTVSVLYSQPDGKQLQLPAGTMFPSAHTQLVLANAAKGPADAEQFFSRRVFDGADESGSSDISAFIGPPHRLAKEHGLGAKLKDNPLLSEATVPVHMAFYDVGTETGEPDYEMDLGLQPNGVAHSLKIDYSDFSVSGTLQDVEALPAQNCP